MFLDYLPYHWLLVSAGVTGYLKYHDTSVGKLVVELKTRMGQPHAMAQNPWNAVMHLGEREWDPVISVKGRVGVREYIVI